MKKSANMQDKNFDNILRDHLSSTQSFDHQDEDWAVMSEQLDVLMPQKRRRVSAIWLLTVGLLFTSSITFYTLHKLDIIGTQLKDINTSIEEEKIANQPIAKADTNLERGEANVRLSLNEHELNTNTNIFEKSSLGTFQSSNSIIGNQNKTQLSLSTTPSFIGRSIVADMKIKLPTNTSFLTPSKKDEVSPNTITDNFTISKPATDITKKPIEKKEETTPKVIKKEHQPIEKEVEKVEEKPYAFLTPLREEILNVKKQYAEKVAAEQKKEKETVAQNNNQSNTPKELDQKDDKEFHTGKSKLRIATENFLAEIEPKGYALVATVGRGVSPLEFENKDNLFEGGLFYGAKCEIVFNQYFRIYGKLDHLHQQLVYHGPELTAPGLLGEVETPANHFLDKTVANQSFLQGTLGLKATRNFLQNNKLMLYAGFGIPTQLRLRQNYEYAFKSISGDDVVKDAYIGGAGRMEFNSLNFNSGVEYDLTDKVSVQLEGNYNMPIPERSGYVPDVFSVSVGIAYNWGERS